MNRSDSNRNHSIELKLCKDPMKVAEIFKQDYFDAVRYLLKAGWEVFQTTAGDIYVRKAVSKDQI